MPVYSGIATEPGDDSPWIPAEWRGTRLKASGDGLTHEYEDDAQALAESDWVYLQVSWIAWQVHPITCAEMDVYGPIGGREMLRWTPEGPTSIRPGELPNCTIKVEVAHSLTATPGSDWRDHVPGGLYKLRSFKSRLIITRSSVDHDFRVLKFSTTAMRRAPPQIDVYGMRFFNHG